MRFPDGFRRRWRSTTPGKEVAYDDDYRFNPDPVLFQMPKSDEYVVEIKDAIYRGREDFVYRITIGELPFVTSIFPLGGRGRPTRTTDRMKGWNLQAAELTLRRQNTGPGVYPFARARTTARIQPRAVRPGHAAGMFEKEPNNDPGACAEGELPVIINGRIDSPDDWDVFQFTGHAGETIVAEVMPAGSIPRWIRAQTHRRPRQTAGHSTTTTKTRRPEPTRTTPIPTLRSSCPRTARITCTWATAARQRRGRIWLPAADQRAAARLRFAGCPVECPSAQGERQSRDRLRRPQRRIQGPDQAELEGPAGGIRPPDGHHRGTARRANDDQSRPRCCQTVQPGDRGEGDNELDEVVRQAVPDRTDASIRGRGSSGRGSEGRADL